MANWMRMCANVINEYYRDEFGHDADYSDPSSVSLAFTSIDSLGDVDVHVSVDLVHFTVSRLEVAPDGDRITFMHSFATLPQLYNWLCGNLDFEWMAFTLHGRWYTDAHERTVMLSPT